MRLAVFGDLGLHQHADQIVDLHGSACLHDRHHQIDEAPEPEAVGGDRGTDVERFATVTRSCRRW